MHASLCICLCLDEATTLFRATTLASTLMEQYMKATATRFVHHALKDSILKIMESKQSCEVRNNVQVYCEQYRFVEERAECCWMYLVLPLKQCFSSGRLVIYFHIAYCLPFWPTLSYSNFCSFFSCSLSICSLHASFFILCLFGVSKSLARLAKHRRQCPCHVASPH